MKNGVITALALLILSAALWIQDVLSDRKHEIQILKPITLLEKAPQEYPESNNEVGSIKVGDQVAVRRMGYGKDFRAWKIRAHTGQEGWLIEESDNIKIIERQ